MGAIGKGASKGWDYGWKTSSELFGADNPVAKAATADAMKGIDLQNEGANLRPPDLGDDLIKKAQEAERRRVAALQGRSSTFLTGASGDTSTPTLGRKSLLGG